MRLISHFPKSRFNRPAERRRIDRRISVEPRLDLLEAVPQLLAVGQPPLNHLPDIDSILGMPALDLRERLGVEVVVVEGETALPGDESAPHLPAGKLGDELIWSSQLNVELELLRSASTGRRIPPRSRS